MSQTSILLWKSRRDVQWIVVCTLYAILGPSCVEAISGSGVPDMAGDLAMLFGPMVAILLGVTLTCRDLGEPLVTFWSSRPISAARFVVAKFIVGLVALFMVTVLPTAVELGLRRDSWWLVDFTIRLLVVKFPVQLLVFACSFALGCVVRRAVPAALLSCAAGLLIYFGPILVHGLGFLDPWQWTSSRMESTSGEGLSLFKNPRFLLFLGAQAALIIGLMACSIVLVRRHTKREAGHRTIAWVLSLVGLSLFWGIGRDLGTTLPLQRLIKDSSPVVAACIRDGKGVVATKDDKDEFSISRFDEASRPIVSKPLFTSSLSSAGITEWRGGSNRAYPLAWPAGRNDRAMTIVARFGAPEGDSVRRLSLELVTLDPSKPKAQAETGRVDIAPWFDAGSSTTCPRTFERIMGTYPSLFVEGDRLIVSGPRSDGDFSIAIFDIANPDAPKHIATTSGLLCIVEFNIASPEIPKVTRASTSPSTFFEPLVEKSSGDEVSIRLPELPGLSTRQILDYLLAPGQLNGSDAIGAIEGNILVAFQNDVLSTYQLLDAKTTTGGKERREIRVRRLGSVSRSLLERVADKKPTRLVIGDGIVYGQFDAISDGVEAWDIRDPRHIRSLGSYCTPLEFGWHLVLAPLPNYRLLVGGTQMYIVGPVVKGMGKGKDE